MFLKKQDIQFHIVIIMVVDVLIKPGARESAAYLNICHSMAQYNGWYNVMHYIMYYLLMSTADNQSNQWIIP